MTYSYLKLLKEAASEEKRQETKIQMMHDTLVSEFPELEKKSSRLKYAISSAFTDIVLKMQKDAL